jgi:hypothetical protein
MNVPVILLVLAVLGCFWNIATSIRIYDFLRRRGVKASFFWLRVMAPKYAHQYKKMTAARRGRRARSGFSGSFRPTRPGVRPRRAHRPLRPSLISSLPIHSAFQIMNKPKIADIK